MNPGARGISEWMKTVYEKLVLFVVLFVLLLSGILLGVFVDHEKKLLAAAQWTRPDVPPRRSNPADTTALQTAIESLAEPFQMGYGSNRMMVAELRVACVQCGRPIPINATVCPFRNCGVPQPAAPVPQVKDSDMDQMPDEWERKHGLNPTADDAQRDADEDQFSNLEEYRFHTNPQDPKDFPPPVSKLRWVRTGKIPLPFSFQSVQHPAPGERLFVLKNRKTHQDYYVKIGDKIEGYEIIDFEEKKAEVMKQGLPAPILEDASILKLRKDSKVIVLTVGQDSGEGQMAAELVFLVDNSRYFVKVNDVFTLKNNQYKVVDIRKDAVVVFDISAGKEVVLEKHSE